MEGLGVRVADARDDVPVVPGPTRQRQRCAWGDDVQAACRIEDVGEREQVMLVGPAAVMEHEQSFGVAGSWTLLEYERAHLGDLTRDRPGRTVSRQAAPAPPFEGEKARRSTRTDADGIKQRGQMTDSPSMDLVGSIAARLQPGVAAVGVVVVLAASGCVGGGAPGVQGTVVRITERDFKISAPRTVPAGDVVIRVHNRGPVAHELIVVRAGHKPLPLRGDGLTVNEESLEGAEAGALEPGRPGSVRVLAVRLTPGRYVLFCNMSGHYMGGMRRTLVVR
jgi:hypothetical protein